MIKIIDSLECGDLRIILDTTWDARSLWESVGLQLGLLQDSLDAIKSDYKQDCGERFKATLNKWLKGKHPRPTRAALAKALDSRTVSMGYLVKKLPSMEESEL
jgi:hypothetical protein